MEVNTLSDVQLAMSAHDFLELYLLYKETAEKGLDVSLKRQRKFNKSYTLEVGYNKQERLNRDFLQIERLCNKVFASILPNDIEKKRKMAKHNTF